MNEENMANALSDIASDLGFEKTDAEEAEVVDTETPETGETSAPANATEGVAKDETADAAAAAPVARQAPKAWAKEQHERWGKIDKDTQDYIELREKQMLEGLSQYGDKAKRADEWEGAVKDYMPLIQAQGIAAPAAVKYLFEAHRSLSSGTPEQKAAYLAQVAKSYGIDFAKAAATAGAAAEETPGQRETRERLERLEGERAQEKRQAAEATQKRVAGEVSAFADAKDEKGNAKHPYFDECAEDIVALINAGHALDKAYEKAVYANPVTRAKELARLRTEDDAKLRDKAKQEADKARNASRTNVTSRDTRRAPTASKTGKWEDTLTETLQEIKARQTH